MSTKPQLTPAQEFAERFRVAGERTNTGRERRYQAERDLLVAFLTRVWPLLDDRITAHIAPSGSRRPFYSEVVCIHTPTVGQLAWGLSIDRPQLFAHLPRYDCKWDGHGAAERFARLRALLKAPEDILRLTPRRRRRTTKGSAS